MVPSAGSILASLRTRSMTTQLISECSMVMWMGRVWWRRSISKPRTQASRRTLIALDHGCTGDLLKMGTLINAFLRRTRSYSSKRNTSRLISSFHLMETVSKSQRLSNLQSGEGLLTTSINVWGKTSWARIRSFGPLLSKFEDGWHIFCRLLPLILAALQHHPHLKCPVVLSSTVNSK